MDNTEYVRKDLRDQQAMRIKYERMLKALPEGKLCAFRIRDKLYYSRRRGRVKTYLGDGNHREVKALQRRCLLESIIANMDNNIPLMENYLQHYKSVDLLEVADTLPTAYSTADFSGLLKKELCDAKTWEEEPYERADHHLDELKHRTRKGDMVRSKSEVIIADILKSRGIPYHYEEVTKINGVTMAPDFKVAVISEGRYKFLEHCGMIGNYKYRNNFLWRLKNYLEDGFVPWRDVIFTFDDLDGNIDTMAINRIIDHFLV